MERVISDECLDAIRRRCYEAGRAGREVYTVRDADGPKVVRCRDCKYANRYGYQLECVRPIQGAYSECTEVYPEDFCSYGERRGD